MKLLGKNQITTIDLPDQIQFVVVREQGLLVLILPPALCLGTILYGWFSRHWYFIPFGLIGLAYIAVWHLRGPVTKLFVTQDQLIAAGNLERLITSKITIPADEIKYLGFSTGGENQPIGLYALRGWHETCVLPGLGKKDVMNIADAIHAKFPRYKRQDEPGVAAVFH